MGPGWRDREGIPLVAEGLPAHGAGIPTLGFGEGVDDHWALVAGCGRADAWLMDGAATSCFCGWLDACAELGGGMASGLRSQLKREPKRKCWTTGNLERTSALYILIIPFWGEGFS